jgi:DNA-binding LacI/PurR family transcriptional regulator
MVRWNRFHGGEGESRAVVTIAEVAKQAGVGVATVSRVLNGSPAVREKTRVRVRDAIDDLGYAPNAAARALSTGRSLAVAVVAPFFTRPSVMQRLRGVSQVLAGAGYQLVLFDVERPGEEAEYFRRLAAGGGLDALLAMSLCPAEDDLERFAEAGVPVVLVDHPHASIPAVHTDDVAGGRLATEHLLELGHLRVAFLGDFEHNYHGFTSSARRRAGYEAALAGAGIEADPDLVLRGPHGQEPAAALTREALDRPDPPTALFAASDTQAVGALEAAEALGARVPGDLSVIGYDDIELARHAGLTTVAQPLEESGACGAEMLLNALEGRRIRGRQLPLRLVVRHTTGAYGKNRGRAARHHQAWGKDRLGQSRQEGMRLRS